MEEGAAECRQASAVEGQDGVGRGELVVEKDSEGVGEGGREVRGPRLQIKIRVIEFQRTEEDFTYTIEVRVVYCGSSCEWKSSSATSHSGVCLLLCFLWQLRYGNCRWK